MNISNSPSSSITSQDLIESLRLAREENPFSRQLIIVPSLSFRQTLKRKLRKAFQSYAGISILTPRECFHLAIKELAPHLNLIPDAAWIPFFMEKNWNLNSIAEWQTLHPDDWKFFAENFNEHTSPMEAFANASFFPENKIKEFLCERPAQIFAKIYLWGFHENDPEFQELRKWIFCLSSKIQSFTLPELYNKNAEAQNLEFVFWNQNEDLSVGILGKIVSIFKEAPESSIFVAIPEGHYLWRKLPEFLENLAIPFSSQLPYFSKEENEGNELLQKWITFQNHPMRKEFLTLLECATQQEHISWEHFHEWRKEIQEFCQFHLNDHIENIPEGARWLGELLPTRATFTTFIEKTPKVLPELEAVLAPFQYLQQFYSTLSAVAYLEILKRALQQFFTKEKKSRNPNSTIQLITPSEIMGLDAGCIIFADCSQTYFDPQFNGYWLNEYRCCDLDHLETKGNYQSPKQKRELYETRWQDFLQNFPGKISLFFSPFQNEFFESSDPEIAPIFLDCQNFDFIAGEKNAKYYWEIGNRIQNQPIIFSNSEDDSILPVKQTQIAYEARRDPKAPFGIYDFGLTEEFAQEFTHRIPCKDWEFILKKPEEKWHKIVMGIRDVNLYNTVFDETLLLTGTWTHEILSEIIESFSFSLANFSEEHLQKLVKQTIQKRWQNSPKLLWQHAFFHELESTIYDLLLQVTKLCFNNTTESISSEYEISGKSLLLGKELTLKGRLDLLLKSKDGKLQIIDFKTHNKDSLTTTQISKGNYLQLALYGKYFLREDNDVELKILSPRAKPKAINARELFSGSLDEFWSDFLNLTETLQMGYCETGYNQKEKSPYSYRKPDSEIIKKRRKLFYPNFKI